ncbi:MAG: hypothetical protein GX222_08585 [Ruminococcaceae bacterium]|nr:hypothetical protein [Oscillospiraceae bacterium]
MNRKRPKNRTVFCIAAIIFIFVFASVHIAFKAVSFAVVLAFVSSSLIVIINCFSRKSEYENDAVTDKVVDTKRLPKYSDTDLIYVFGSRVCCEECAKYINRVYSISVSSKYPSFLEYLNNSPGCCPHTEVPFYDGFSQMKNSDNNPVDPVEYSNRPFVDDRTEEEKKKYEEKIRKAEKMKA